MHALSGIYAAALTPLNSAGAPSLSKLPRLLDFLAERGCHGALLLGTTGEGPSFSPSERQDILNTAADWRRANKGFRLLAGTGTPSITETIGFNRMAFDLGYDAVVVLPPYYFRSAHQDGLFSWFKRVMDESVPSDGRLLAYHIPQVSGVALDLDLLQRLARAYPTKFAGLKDSSGSLPQAQAYAAGLPEQAVLVGNDRLIGAGLAAGAAGAITALANLASPMARAIYDAHMAGEDGELLQAVLDPLRAVLDAHPPAPAFLKALLRELHGLDAGPVRPPLLDLPPHELASALAEFERAGVEVSPS